MAPDLDNVMTTVSIKGELLVFIQLELSQSFNEHHAFVVKVHELAPKNVWQQKPETYIGYLGEEIRIVMKHRKSGVTNEFVGIVTHVRMVGNDKGHTTLVVQGNSPTILLDGNVTMDSFTDKTLGAVIRDVTQGYGGVRMVCAPEFKATLPYLVQHKESVFHFLNRLSAVFHEWFFYNGKTVFFGKPDSIHSESIVYDMANTFVTLVSSLVPPNFSKFDYAARGDNLYESEAPGKAEGMDKFLRQVSDKSQKAYGASAAMPSVFPVQTKVELDDAVKAEKASAASGMIHLEGRSCTCRIRIGEIIKVTFPNEMNAEGLGQYLITRVTHTVSPGGHYSNVFWGVPAGLEAVPVPGLAIPIAMPEMATVKDNKDEDHQGRVKVAFNWQKDNKTTNWIRVQTPDAGVSDKVSQNRGFMFVPEIGDQVMVSYEYGDPCRPYVSGSLFHGKSGKGGDDNNKVKGITTRSGCSVVFNDDENEGSIVIRDSSGSMITLKGDKTIEISAAEKITFAAKEIILNGSDSVSLNSDKLIESKSSDAIRVQATGKILNSADSEISIESKNKLSASGMVVKIDGSTKTTVHGMTLDVVGDTVTNVKGLPLNLN